MFVVGDFTKVHAKEFLTRELALDNQTLSDDEWESNIYKVMQDLINTYIHCISYTIILVQCLLCEVLKHSNGHHNTAVVAKYDSIVVAIESRTLLCKLNSIACLTFMYMY
jgi:hypothetical protein